MLKDRVALVTGAGAGIGRAIALAFANARATVVVAELNAQSGAQVVAEIVAAGMRAHYIAIDIRQPQSVAAAVQQTQAQFGQLDILVNNAYPTMVYAPARLEDIDEERLAAGMTAGFQAVASAMRAAMPGMRAQGFGRIINICSLNGVNAHKYTADYNSAKEAVRAYTRTAAVEWARHGITANIICPGAITTPLRALQAHNAEMLAQIEAMNPMGYLGDPLADIAPVAVFLASDMARYLTGNTLFVDGGGHINGVPWSPEPGA